MGALTKRQKARLQWRLPDHNTTKEQQMYYDYCVQKNIRISPIGIKDQPGKWYIGVSTPDNYRKIYKSKYIYDREQIWDEMFNMCKYYYDKK